MTGPSRPSHLAFNTLPASTNAAIQSADPAEPTKIRSIPYFTSSFGFRFSRSTEGE